MTDAAEPDTRAETPPYDDRLVTCPECTSTFEVEDDTLHTCPAVAEGTDALAFTLDEMRAARPAASGDTRWDAGWNAATESWRATIAARLAQRAPRAEDVAYTFRIAAELTVQDVRAQRGDYIAGLVEESFAAHFDRAERLAQRDATTDGGQ